MKTLRGLLIAGALLTMAGGCASAGGSGGGDTGIPVVVDNNVAPPNNYTVWVVTDAGARFRLGTVSPNATGRFRFRIPSTGQYRLVAEPRTGDTVRSYFFNLSDASGQIEWDMGASSVVVR